MKSFLQTIEWLEFQKSIGRKTWRFDDGKVITNIVQHDLPFGMNYLYIPHGPEINFDNITGGLKNELEQFILYIKNLAREQKSIFIKIEPLRDSVIELLYGAGFKKSSKEIQAHKSIVLDIDKPEEELLAGMHHKTRYNVRVAEKNGIIIQSTENVDAFYELLRKTTKRQRFSTHTKEYYKKFFEFFGNANGQCCAEIILAVHDDRPLQNVHSKPVAGGLMLTYGDTCYYLHGGSDHELRQYMAPYGLHWGMIKFLKTRGIKHYDFGGSETTKWPGITRFKLGWGGRQVEYPGSFDMSIRPLWFFVYKIVRKIF